MRTTPTGISLLPALALCTLPLWVYGVLCGSTGHDDSHITFWQAHTLLAHGELLNYNGARVEQSSSLLLVLLTALAGLAGLPLVTAGYLINLAGAVATLAAVWAGARRAGLTTPWLPVLLVALTPYFAYWAWSGMETTLAAAVALLFVLAVERWLQQPDAMRAALLALSALALAAVRPEMVLVGPALLVAVAVLLRRPGLLPFVLCFAALAAWRHGYFGQWLPNPVYTKSGDPGLAQLQRGIDYSLRLFRHPLSATGVSLTLLGLAGSVFVALRRRSPLLVVCCLWTLIYAGFVVSSGGDWMKEGRFWVPLVAPLWLATCLAWTGDWGRWLPRLALPLLLAYSPSFISAYSLGTPWWQHARLRAIAGPDASVFELANREHLREWPALQVLQQAIPQLAREPGKPLTVMSKQMGMVNFHLLQAYGTGLQVIDMAGLVDNRLRDCPVMAQDGFDVQGLRLNYRKFFDRLPAARLACGIEAPDIIHDLYGWGESVPLPDFLATHGYAIVFRQTGQLAIQPGRVISAQQMVAIRRERLAGGAVETRWLDLGALLGGANGPVAVGEFR